MAYTPAYEGLRRALEQHHRAVALNPHDPHAHNNLAIFLLDRGELADALAAVDQALRVRPDFIPALLTRGNILKGAGQLNAALQQYQTVLNHQRDNPDALAQIADLLRLDGQIERSIDLSRRILQGNPHFAEAHHTLANALSARGELQAAIDAYTRAIALRPDHAEAYHNLALALLSANQIEDALAAFRAAARHRPFFAEALANAAGLLRDQGQLDESLGLYRQAVALKPYLTVAHSNLVYAMHLSPAIDAKQIFDEHVRWAQVHAAPLAAEIKPHDNDRNPDRRLRIGYVSPDFRDHSVARFFLPLLRIHDRAQYEIHCFASNVRPSDEITQQIRTLSNAFHDVAHLPHDQLANLIRAHHIDILVDLSGHTAHNRLLTFARKPAPIQFSYLGYPGTTGLLTIDYRITDALADPRASGIGSQHSALSTEGSLHTEQLIRLPHGFLCYEPPTFFPEIRDLPATTNNHITFGSFNNFSKVTPQIIASWSRILGALSTAHLMIKSTVLVDPRTRAKIFDRLIHQGLPADRVTLLAPIPSLYDHLSTYNQIDMALDTFPYNGTTTTCEALFMGVPVITLAGDRHASRVGLDILTRLDLAELIATSHEAYEQTAIALAGEIPKLQSMRQTLRPRLQSSPLMNAPLITHDLESAYRTAWRTWSSSQ